MSKDAPAILLTSRIRLRRFEPDDANLLCTLNGDEGVMKYIDHSPPSREKVETEVQRIIQGYNTSTRFGRWIAETTTMNGMEFIGWFGLDMQKRATHSSDENGVAESSGDRTVEEMPLHQEDVRLMVGYRLRRRFWGQGLATEGTRALINYAFGSPDVTLIEAETMFVNLGSRRVMEKCGMKYVKTFHVHFDDPLPGTELGEVLYAISRKKWLGLYSGEKSIPPGGQAEKFREP
ncbi:GNAT family acetyltransferase [Arthroderma uncinatum]|uniref:GNAT family acetyltransferase n=1 Tax=Arthroderma uncinatum TaxID=74035 RepID=UPI00144A9FDF|nr:GNAT family acetyltransferase [Arthroderma uncinatum]KAF3480858.1 GNAT family acetyltransferase [Arthroderma uncinatum]